MDEQTASTIITLLRQKLADEQWQNVQLQAELIRLRNETTQVEGRPSE